MKYLGIDFGSKRVGIAVSDDSGRLAFPKMVLDNKPSLLEEVIMIAMSENIDKIVLGESKNFQGEPNKIMNQIEDFAKRIREKTKFEVLYEPEFLSSIQAERLQGKNEMQDASAAAVILQSYLDRNN